MGMGLHIFTRPKKWCFGVYAKISDSKFYETYLRYILLQFKNKQ